MGEGGLIPQPEGATLDCDAIVSYPGLEVLMTNLKVQCDGKSKAAQGEAMLP